MSGTQDILKHLGALDTCSCTPAPLPPRLVVPALRAPNTIYDREHQPARHARILTFDAVTSILHLHSQCCSPPHPPRTSKSILVDTLIFESCSPSSPSHPPRAYMPDLERGTSPPTSSPPAPSLYHYAATWCILTRVARNASVPNFSRVLKLPGSSYLLSFMHRYLCLNCKTLL